MAEDDAQKITDEQAKPKRDPATGQWLPGASGNPKGRPPDRLSLTAILRRILTRKVNPTDINDDRTIASEMMEAAVAHAQAGNAAFFTQLMDRMDGRVPERTEVRLSGGWRMNYQPEDGEGDGEIDAAGGEVGEDA